MPFLSQTHQFGAPLKGRVRELWQPHLRTQTQKKTENKTHLILYNWEAILDLKGLYLIRCLSSVLVAGVTHSNGLCCFPKIWDCQGGFKPPQNSDHPTYPFRKGLSRKLRKRQRTYKILPIETHTILCAIEKQAKGKLLRSLKLHSPCKLMVGRCNFLLGPGLFSGALAVSFRQGI